MQDLLDKLLQGSQALGLELTEEQQHLLLDYLFLLEKWNKHFNLTAVRDIEQMLYVHILDSLSIARFVKGDSLLDVGTGAGLPGIPLAIFYPEKRVTLLDGNGKKIRFCRQVVLELGLENVNPVHIRIEKMDHQVSYSTITTRAFTDLGHMLDLIGPIMDEKTRLLAMKGQSPGKEIQDIQEKGYTITVDQLHVPGISGARHVITIRK